MQNSQKHIDENINEIAPLLTSFKVQNNFQTPDNYFDELPSILSDKIKSKESSVWTKLKFSFIVPSLTIALLGWFVFNNSLNNDSVSINMSSDEFYSELISDEEGIDIDILFDEPTLNFNDFEYIDEEVFEFELPLETGDLELNIMFN